MAREAEMTPAALTPANYRVMWAMRTASAIGLFLIGAPLLAISLSLIAFQLDLASSQNDALVFVFLLMSSVATIPTGIIVSAVAGSGHPWKQFAAGDSLLKRINVLKRSIRILCFVGAAALTLLLAIDALTLPLGSGETVDQLVKPGVALTGVVSSVCCWIGAAWRDGWPARSAIFIQVTVLLVSAKALADALPFVLIPWLLLMGHS
jgi:hypothetical protein